MIFLITGTQLLCDSRCGICRGIHALLQNPNLRLKHLGFPPTSPLHGFLPNYKCKPGVNDALFASVGRQSENSSADGFDCFCVKIKGRLTFKSNNANFSVAKPGLFPDTDGPKCPYASGQHFC